MKCICGKCNFITTTYICNTNIYYNNHVIRKKAGVIIHNN